MRVYPHPPPTPCDQLPSAWPLSLTLAFVPARTHAEHAGRHPLALCGAHTGAWAWGVACEQGNFEESCRCREDRKGRGPTVQKPRSTLTCLLWACGLTHTHTYISTHMHAHTRMYVSTNTHTRTRTTTHTHTHTHTRTHTHTHTHAYIHTHVHTHTPRHHALLRRSRARRACGRRRTRGGRRAPCSPRWTR